MWGKCVFTYSNDHTGLSIDRVWNHVMFHGLRIYWINSRERWDPQGNWDPYLFHLLRVRNTNNVPETAFLNDDEPFKFLVISLSFGKTKVPFCVQRIVNVFRKVIRGWYEFYKDRKESREIFLIWNYKRLKILSGYDNLPSPKLVWQQKYYV